MISLASHRLLASLLVGLCFSGTLIQAQTPQKPNLAIWNNGCANSTPKFETAQKEHRILFSNQAITIFTGVPKSKDGMTGITLYSKSEKSSSWKCFDAKYFVEAPLFYSAVANNFGSVVYVSLSAKKLFKSKDQTVFTIFRLNPETGLVHRVLDGAKAKLGGITRLSLSPNGRQLAFFAQENGGFGITPFLLTLGDFANPSQTKPSGSGLRIDRFPFDFNVVGGLPCFSAGGKPMTCKP